MGFDLRQCSLHVSRVAEARRPVAVVGLGASGRAAVTLLRALGRAVVASDEREVPVDLQRRAAQDGGLEVHGGRLVVPPGCTEVVLTPGLNPEWREHADRPLLRQLHEAACGGELRLVSEVVLALECFAGPRVVVGGTDGKSTTAALTQHLLGAVGVSTVLGGNSWRPLADAIGGEGAESKAVVAEVSAFQLWHPEHVVATVGILTNVADDHLDHYPDMATYAAAKRRLLGGPGVEVKLMHGGDARLRAWGEGWLRDGDDVRFFADSDPTAWAHAEGSALQVGPDVRVDASGFRLPGAHNARNALAALGAAREVAARLGVAVSPSDWARALAGFRGLPHRLEWVCERGGVTWRNDSKATNLHASMVGLSSLEGTLVAIVGGVDKGLSLEPWLTLLRARCRAVVVFGALRARLIEAAAGDPLFEARETLEEAVAHAAAVACPGDTVVLSPGASSFDQFPGFEARGQAFRSAVAALSE